MGSLLRSRGPTIITKGVSAIFKQHSPLDGLNIEGFGFKEAQIKLTKVERDILNDLALHRKVGEKVVDWVHDNFDKKHEAGGKPWTGLEESTKVAKRKKGRRKPDDPLFSTGRLFRSIKHEVQFGRGVSETVSRIAPERSTGQRLSVKARVHQFGGTSTGRGSGHDIPARPYLGLSGSQQVKIGRMFENHLRESVRRNT